MKHRSIFITLTFAFCSILALSGKEYVMLSPLDTASLPVIPAKDCGGKLVRNALNNDAIWQSTLRQLAGNNFSN